LNTGAIKAPKEYKAVKANQKTFSLISPFPSQSIKKDRFFVNKHYVK
jgi:hypothetical protein